MFKFPKKSKQEQIPPGLIPTDRINFLLNELGFYFLTTVEQNDVIKNLIDKKDPSKP
jgi:hypothetical protein